MRVRNNLRKRVVRRCKNIFVKKKKEKYVSTHKSQKKSTDAEGNGQMKRKMSHLHPKQNE